jgi:hypothetical protein
MLAGGVHPHLIRIMMGGRGYLPPLALHDHSPNEKNGFSNYTCSTTETGKRGKFVKTIPLSSDTKQIPFRSSYAGKTKKTTR